MKYCKDCKWYPLNILPWYLKWLKHILPECVKEGMQCYHTKAASRYVDTVSGKTHVMHRWDCNYFRIGNSMYDCGEEAKFFEDK